MAKCNHNCFECTYDDCILDDKEITSVERMEIRQRDNRYFNSIESRAIIKQKPTRARKCRAFT